MVNTLLELSKLFLKMIRVSDLPWKDLITALKNGEFDQNGIADATVCHPILKLYPPSSEYLKIFLKRLIRELENTGVEVIEEIYNVYIGLISKVDLREEFYYCTYTFNTDLQISLKETKNLIVDGTTGLTTWQASHVLVQYCLEQKSSFKSKKVLELGSGLGLTGLALIKASNPQSYTFTDHHPKVLEYLRHNVNSNLSSGNEKLNGDCENVSDWKGTAIEIKALDWESPSEVGECDIVIGADILFDQRLIPHLVALLKTSLRNERCKAIIAATIRNEETFDCFIRETEKQGLVFDRMEERSYQESASHPSALVKIVALSRT